MLVVVGAIALLIQTLIRLDKRERQKPGHEERIRAKDIYDTIVALQGIALSLEVATQKLTIIAKAITNEPKLDEEELELDPATRHRMRTKLRRDEWRNNASA